MFDCLLTRESGEPWVCANVEDELDVLARFPLYQRGWTFQERLLSNRTLHFGRQLVWECDAGLATEVCPELITTKHDATRTIKRTFAGSQYKFPPPRMLVGAFSALWKMVVVSFSKMQLTYSSDKVPALQGITNRLGYRLSLDPADYYVAGLWVVECSQLSWLRESHQNWLTSEDNEVACKPCKKPPSWSWTVCAEAVKIPGGAFQPIDLVVLGAVPVRSRDAGLRHMVTVHECISTVLFKDNAAAREPEPFTGLTLRGKFIHWFQIHTILQLGQRTPEFTIKGYVPTDASKSGSFNIKIILDRPIPEHSSHKGLKLLPIHCNRSQGSSPDEMCGILLAFLGFDEGMALYRRLGQFQVVDLEGSPSCFLRYFHLPRERGTAETHEMPVGLQQELDELPPFKVI